MCGIAGCYQQVDGESLVAVMSDRLRPRGPDDHGLWSYQEGQVSVQLAHRRLSIIDLSEGGHQPVARGGLTLVYNGELYNYRELRAELVGRGVRFETSSDTEVVLEAWRQWGPAALPRFRGMFAFAIFDERSGRLVLARDPLGIKPLHYLPRRDGVVFASELKSLVAALGDTMTADPAALVASMLYYWVPPDRCAIEGVGKVPPGSWVEFAPGGRHSMHRYWAVEEVAAAAAASPPADPAAHLREVIEASVDAHLVADVGVATFLSGGLDSSIISVLAKRRIPDLAAYTIAFRPEDNRIEAMPDDARYARKVASRYGIALHEIDANPDIVGLLGRMVDVLDEPVGDPAAINTLLMCEAAGDAGVKVMLSGIGADELFGGYRKHLACKLAATYRRTPGVARRGVEGVVGRLPVVAGGRGLRSVRWAKRFLDFAELPEAEAFRRSYTLYDPSGLSDLVSPEMAGAVDEIVAAHDAVYHDSALTDPVDRMCLTDTRMFLPGLNLAYTDRASMAASMEVRTPFVDPVVAEAAFSLPASDKIRGRRSKAALKDAAMAWLPDEIVNRPKASFGVPLRAWISRDLAGVIDEELLGGTLVESGFLRREPLARLVADDRSGRQDRSKQIWQLLTTELWARSARQSGVTV